MGGYYIELPIRIRGFLNELRGFPHEFANCFVVHGNPHSSTGPSLQGGVSARSPPAQLDGHEQL